MSFSFEGRLDAGCVNISGDGIQGRKIEYHSTLLA